MKFLRNILLTCVVIWTYPLGDEKAGSIRTTEELRVFVCEQEGEKFLEVRRTVKFIGFRDDHVGDKTLIRLPWGSDKIEEPKK